MFSISTRQNPLQRVLSSKVRNPPKIPVHLPFIKHHLGLRSSCKQAFPKLNPSLSDHLTEIRKLNRFPDKGRPALRSRARGGGVGGTGGRAGSGERRVEGRNGNRSALFISQLLSWRTGSAGAVPRGSHSDPDVSLSRDTRASPQLGPTLPARVPDSQCTRGPARGIAALARIALHSQLLPYSAQHDWGWGVSGPGEDQRR